MKPIPIKADESGCYLVPFVETARRLGISRETLYRWIDDKQFPKPLKQGRKSYFMLSDIENHVSKLKRNLNPCPTRS